MPRPIKADALRISLRFPTAIPKARLRIGSINGATIMAPITTAGLLETNPKVAITADVISNTVNSRDGVAASKRSFVNSSSEASPGGWMLQVCSFCSRVCGPE